MRLLLMLDLLLMLEFSAVRTFWCITLKAFSIFVIETPDVHLLSLPVMNSIVLTGLSGVLSNVHSLHKRLELLTQNVIPTSMRAFAI